MYKVVGLFLFLSVVPVVAMKEKEDVAVKNSPYKEKKERKIAEMISLMQAFMSTNGITAETSEESGTIYLNYKHFQNDAITYYLSLDKARKKLKKYLSPTNNGLAFANYCAHHRLYWQYKCSTNSMNLHYFQQDTLPVLYTICLHRWDSFMSTDPRLLGNATICTQLDREKVQKMKKRLLDKKLAMQEIAEKYSERYKLSHLPQATYMIEEYLKAYHAISFNRMAWRAAFMYATTAQEINAAAQLPLQIWSNKPESIVHARELAIRSFEYEVQKQKENSGVD